MSHIIRLRKSKYKANPIVTINNKKYIEVSETKEKQLRIEINNLVVYPNTKVDLVDNAIIDLQGTEIRADHTNLQINQYRKSKTIKPKETNISLLEKDILKF